MLMICLTAGCAHFNSEYDCPASKGLGCKRLSSINEEYNHKKGLPSVEVMDKDIAVYLKGFQDKQGTYHHPKKLTVKVD